MDTNKLYSEMEEMQSKLKQMQAEFRTKMQKTFTDITAQFFKETPSVKAVVWNQYTPYFNDGDECVFGVGDVYFLEEFDPTDLEDAYSYESRSLDIDATPEKLERYNRYATERGEDSEYWLEEAARIKKALDNDDGTIERCRIIQDVVSSNDDLMKAIFGDHVTVYLTADGTITEEYDHE